MPMYGKPSVLSNEGSMTDLLCDHYGRSYVKQRLNENLTSSTAKKMKHTRTLKVIIKQ